MANELNSNQIAQILPHRFPFALVDRITDYEPGQWAKGRKCVSVNEQFFCGHFPQEHVMPGVLILEAMAQVGAVAVLSKPENQGKLAFFGGIKNARFKSKVTPGDVVVLAGKGHETYQEIDGVQWHLDEREEVAAYFSK